MKTIFMLVTLAAAISGGLPARGAMPVIDVSVLGQVIQEVKVTTKQLEQLTLQVKRLGDPAKTKLPSAREVIRSLGQRGVGVTLDELQSSALVPDDLWHNGELVVPTGTEVHGRARADHLRDRIVASGAWTLVWQTGEELVVNGIALDREEHPTRTAWGLDDDGAGLRGQVLRSDQQSL